MNGATGGVHGSRFQNKQLMYAITVDTRIACADDAGTHPSPKARSPSAATIAFREHHMSHSPFDVTTEQIM